MIVKSLVELENSRNLKSWVAENRVGALEISEKQ